MANPSKQKGTAGETELLRLMNELRAPVRPAFVRTAPTLPYDICGAGIDPTVEVLATRPDRGDWLVSLRLVDFMDLLNSSDYLAEEMGGKCVEVHVESKRYARMVWHTIFTGKFGKDKG